MRSVPLPPNNLTPSRSVCASAVRQLPLKSSMSHDAPDVLYTILLNPIFKSIYIKKRGRGGIRGHSPHPWVDR